MAIKTPYWSQISSLNNAYCVVVKYDPGTSNNADKVTAIGGNVYNMEGTKLGSTLATPPVAICPEAAQALYPVSIVKGTGTATTYALTWSTTADGKGPQTTINIEVSEGGDDIG